LTGCTFRRNFIGGSASILTLLADDAPLDDALEDFRLDCLLITSFKDDPAADRDDELLELR